VVSSVLLDVGKALGDTSNIGWIISGWSIASAVGFTIAGRLSDVFGRRYIILVGETISVIGAVCEHNRVSS